MNNLFQTVISVSIFFYVNGDLFHRYTGNILDDTKVKELSESGIIKRCAIEVKQCAPHEGSRVDGTCNNYKYPSIGSARGPYLRLLKQGDSNKTEGNNVEYNKTRRNFPSARKLRTALQSTGRVADKIAFNTAAVHYLQFIDRDLSALNGPLDFLKHSRHCCTSEAKSDPRCMPIEVPEDDPYLKVTHIRCLNFTRAETFQHVGCITEMIPPQQINFQTPLLDLSTIYGVDEKALSAVREKEYGLLKMKEKDEEYFPHSNVTKSTCSQGDDGGKVCYNFGFPETSNYDLKTTVFAILFMRQHNHLAKILHELNPCWKDDRLFKVARQINIAIASNIFLYELLPNFLGYQNMLNFGLISRDVEYISAYDEEAVPLIFAEYEVSTKFFHTMLDGRIKKYNENLHYTGELSLSDTIFRQELFERNNNFNEITRGIFLQNAGKIDDIQDPEISERYYGSIEKAHDLIADDIQQGRDLGLRPYVEYRKVCGLNPVNTFEELSDVMDEEKIDVLRTLYTDLADVELLPGIMSERFVSGTNVGPTLLCIMAKQLQALRYTDRFWFERGDQVHSFTLSQLQEIRKSNMARFVCDNAEGIRFMQPRAFFNVANGNAAIPCTHIRGADLRKWKDKSCVKTSKSTDNLAEWKSKPSTTKFAESSSSYSMSLFDNLMTLKSL